MTTINESYTAKGYTPAHLVPRVFGMPRQIEGIVIHHWGLPGQTHQGVVNFFCSTGPGETSAHFVASGYPTKRIDCIVSPLDAAWHSGNARGNATQIGLELRPEATDADYEVAAELVAWLRAEYGANLPLTPHRQWQATACPGQWDLARLDRMARAVTASGNIQPQASIPTKEATVANLTKEEWREGAGVIHNTNIQEFGEDGKTKRGVKTFAYIIGNLNQWVGRILEGQDRIEAKLDIVINQTKKEQ